MFSGMYRGIVKSHGSNGLCKVFVPSIMPQKYENTPNELPWCEPAQPLMFNSTNGGMFQYPEIGEVVWVFFMGGDVSKPIMFATSLGSKFINDPKKFVIKTDTFIMEVDDTQSTTNITINTLNVNSNVNITGNLKVSGNTDIGGSANVRNTIKSGADITSGGDVISSMTTLNTHKHIGNKGSKTSPPV